MHSIGEDTYPLDFDEGTVMMTKKDFVQFAELVRTTPGLSENALFMSNLIGVLGESNPRFDAKRFTEACEPTPTRIRKLHCWICAKCSRVLHGDEPCPKCED